LLFDCMLSYHGSASVAVRIRVDQKEMEGTHIP